MPTWRRVNARGARALAACTVVLPIFQAGMLVSPASAARRLETQVTPVPTSLVADAALSSLANPSSIDNFAVTGYRVYRDGASVGMSTTTSYADMGLASNTTYTYQVTAFDAAANGSAESHTASLLTLPSAPPQDTQAPTAPTNLMALSLSTSQVSLKWDASTGNVGVTEYKVYRQGLAVAFPATTYYVDTGLSAATSYSYQVSAQDAAGNESAKSNTAVTVTPSPGNGGAAVTLPAPGPDLASPTGAPRGPGDAFAGTFIGMVAAGSPVIAAWNETVFPDESFTMTGKAFTTKAGEARGSDTTVWVGGQTRSGFRVKEAQVWNVDDKILSATLPPDLPMGMFFIWVENSVGISAPIAINRSTPQWIGPKGNIVAPGEKARVFGRNLSRNHGTSEAFVYAKASGSSSFTPLTVGKIEPFAVEFTAPSKPGTYDIYVHNGHGGSSGWGEPLKLVVQQPWVRDSYTIVVPPSGGDDTAAIESALAQVASRQKGGTVQLQAGIYIISAMVTIPTKARLLGAGKNRTKIEIRLTAALAHNGVVNIDGDHTAVEGLEVRFTNTGFSSFDSMIGTPTVRSDVVLRDLRLRTDANAVSVDFPHVGIHLTRGEISDVETWKALGLSECTDTWIHHNTFYGDLRGLGAEAAIDFSAEKRVVIEFNHTETPKWTTPMASGEQLAIRMINGNVNAGSNTHNYIANNTTRHTFPIFHDFDTNKGEIILFHGGGGHLTQAVSHSGLVTQVRQDNLIDGIPLPSGASYGISTGALNSDFTWAHVQIVGGTGIGQIRKVVSNTVNTFTVDTAWRIEPDETSKFRIGSIYLDNTIYNNRFSAAPEWFGEYNGLISASVPVAFDGQAWNNVAEGNISSRTEGAGIMTVSVGTQSYWNVFRNNVSTSRQSGIFMAYGEISDVPCGAFRHSTGPLLVGNAIRSDSITMFGPIYTLNQYEKPITMGDYAHSGCYGALDRNIGRGNIYEDVTVSGLERALKAGKYTDSLFRNNTVSVAASPTGMDYNIVDPDELVRVRSPSKPIFIGDTYGAAPIRYAAEPGARSPRLVIPHRVLRLRGPSGSTLTGSIPVYNGGIMASSWSATAQTAWLGVSATNPTLTAESTMGRLTVVANTAGLAPGNYAGTIRVAMGSAAKIVTVRLTIE